MQPLHTVGKGVPDLLVGRNGTNVLLEVKSGWRIPGGGLRPGYKRLTPDEKEWHESWQGQVAVVGFTSAEAVAVIEHLTGDSHVTEA